MANSGTDKGSLKLKPVINKARKPPASTPKQTPPTEAAQPLPTPPATQETPQSDLNENNKRSAPEPTPAPTPIQKRQATDTGLATPAPTQQSQQPQQLQQLRQKPAPTPVMPSRTSSGLSFNQRFNQQQQKQKTQQPLTTRASQTPLQTRATAAPTPTPAPLNTRASQNPLQTRASQAVSGTPAPRTDVGTSSQQEVGTAEKDKENEDGASARGDEDDDEDDQLEVAEGKAESTKLSARQLRTQKMRMKKRPIEEIWREDPDAEPIDTSTFKMADLIHDPGVGRLSSRVIDVTRKHAEMKQRRKDEKAKLRNLTEEELKLDAGDDGTGRRRTVEDEEKQRKERDEAIRKRKEEKKARKKRLKELKKAAEGEEEIIDEDQNENENNESSSDDDDDEEANDQQGPQMRLVNGKLVVDEQSLVVDRSAHSRNDTSAYEVTEELDTDRFVNTNTWRGKGRGRQDRWTRLETEMFYDVSIYLHAILTLTFL